MEQELHSLTTKGNKFISLYHKFRGPNHHILELINYEDQKIEKDVEGQTPSLQVTIINAQTNTYQETNDLAYSQVGHANYIRRPREQMDGRKEKVNKRKYDAHFSRSAEGKWVIKKPHTKKPKPYAESLPQCSKCQYHHVG